MWDVKKIRQDFPILNQKIHNHNLVYLDNAATAQKPKPVITCEKTFYETDNASVHRGLHTLAARSTQAYENARTLVKTFLHANSEEECVFVRGATEGINLIAQSFSEVFIQPGDKILVTQMEHHSNLIPWQMAAKRHNATIKAIPINQKGELILKNLDQLLCDKTKIFALTYVSNTLGTINPIKKIIKKAHKKNIPVFIDAAQAAPHFPINVQELDCDFLVISGHKMFGPTGIGALYAKKPWLERLPPYQGGGSMIDVVTIEQSTYAPPPTKFEAGTPPIAQAICLGKTIEYLMALDWNAIQKYEHELLLYATKNLKTIPGLKIIGTANHKASVISFVMDKIHPHDIASIVDRQGIAIRAGKHCTIPIIDFFSVPATARVSFCFYNTIKEIDALVDSLLSVQALFKGKKTCPS